MRKEKIMTRILFVCHGNICRSPMAEFILKDMVRKRGMADDFFIASAATSNEEIGNPVHPGTRDVLSRLGLSCSGKYAVRMEQTDYEKYDYLIGMDQWNRRNMLRICGDDPEGKIHLLLDFTDSPRDVADPWYTGDFQQTYQDVARGCEEFLNYLKEQGSIDLEGK